MSEIKTAIITLIGTVAASAFACAAALGSAEMNARATIEAARSKDGEPPTAPAARELNPVIVGFSTLVNTFVAPSSVTVVKAPPERVLSETASHPATDAPPHACPPCVEKTCPAASAQRAEPAELPKAAFSCNTSDWFTVKSAEAIFDGNSTYVVTVTLRGTSEREVSILNNNNDTHMETASGRHVAGSLALPLEVFDATNQGAKAAFANGEPLSSRHDLIVRSTFVSTGRDPSVSLTARIIVVHAAEGDEGFRNERETIACPFVPVRPSPS
jgi:hypothetical protein